MMGLDVLVNIANVMFLCSYSVRGILWLRILTVIGSSLLIPYYYLQSQTLWFPIGWSAIFICINLFWIILLLLERRPVPFTSEERRLYDSALRNMSPRDAFRLFRMADWQSVPAGTVILTEGQPVDSLSLIAEGEVEVALDGTVVDSLGPGRFLGGTAFLSPQAQFSAPVTVTATTPCRVAVWNTARLHAQFAKDSDSQLQIAIEANIGLEISRFLKTARAHRLQPGM
ncbi:MAG: popeye domain-containing protein [Rhodobacteraceae bacterium]|nr:popeye domain-containing protein [Paracoccaceae bacterium]